MTPAITDLASRAAAREDFIGFVRALGLGKDDAVTKVLLQKTGIPAATTVGSTWASPLSLPLPGRQEFQAQAERLLDAGQVLLGQVSWRLFLFKYGVGQSLLVTVGAVLLGLIALRLLFGVVGWLFSPLARLFGR